MYSHMNDRIYINQAIKTKLDKYDPLIEAVRAHGRNLTPSWSLPQGNMGHTHKKHQLPSKPTHTSLPPPNSIINNTMKKIHRIPIKYLTYVVFNKQKLDNKQILVLPPI